MSKPDAAPPVAASVEPEPLGKLTAAMPETPPGKWHKTESTGSNDPQYSAPTEPVESEPMAIRQWRRIGVLPALPGSTWFDAEDRTHWDEILHNTSYETRIVYTHPAKPNATQHDLTTEEEFEGYVDNEGNADRDRASMPAEPEGTPERDKLNAIRAVLEAPVGHPTNVVKAIREIFNNG